MRKKLLCLLLCVATAAGTIGMTGCGKNEKDTAISASAEAEDITISTKEILSVSDYDVSDYVKLCDYSNISVDGIDKKDYEATDEQIKSFIEDDLRSYAEYKKTDKTTAEDGDSVNIDYTGTIDGEEFEGGSDTNYDIEIGSGAFIEGFEDQLIGHSVGETFDITITFPEDYFYSAYAGKTAVFSTKINYISEKTSPSYDDLTDDYVKKEMESVNQCTTVKEYKKYAKEQVEKALELQEDAAVQAKVLDKLVEECEVTIPDGLLDKRVSSYMDNLNSSLEQNDETMEEYLTDQNLADEAALREQVQSQTETELKQGLILEAIIKDTSFTITQANLDNFIQSYMNTYGMTEDEFYEYYGTKDEIKLYYAENQILEKLTAKAESNLK